MQHAVGDMPDVEKFFDRPPAPKAPRCTLMWAWRVALAFVMSAAAVA